MQSKKRPITPLLHPKLGVHTPHQSVRSHSVETLASLIVRQVIASSSWIEAVLALVRPTSCSSHRFDCANAPPVTEQPTSVGYFSYLVLTEGSDVIIDRLRTSCFAMSFSQHTGTAFILMYLVIAPRSKNGRPTLRGRPTPRGRRRSGIGR